MDQSPLMCKLEGRCLAGRESNLCNPLSTHDLPWATTTYRLLCAIFKIDSNRNMQISRKCLTLVHYTNEWPRPVKWDREALPGLTCELQIQMSSCASTIFHRHSASQCPVLFVFLGNVSRSMYLADMTICGSRWVDITMKFMLIQHTTIECC